MIDNPQPKSYIPNPPPLDATDATWFTPIQVDTLLASRRATATYRRWYQARSQESPPYPYRIIIARPTGLPVFLRGFLDVPIPITDANDQRAIDIADQWVFADRHVTVLFGLTTENTRHRFKLAPAPLRVRPHIKSADLQTVDEVGKQVLERLEQERDEYAALLAPQAHVHFQQWHDDWPLFGAQVVAHLTSNDGRASITSSYYPIDDAKKFEPVLTTPQAAFGLAFTALDEYVHSADYAEHIGLPLPDLEKWLPNLAPYVGQERLILPFAGDYHLVYQVEMSSPDYEQVWRAFVDCEREIVLGQPEPIKLHAQYYNIASDVLAVPAILQDLHLASNPCANFLDIGIYQAGVPINDGAVDWANSNSANNGDKPSVHFEAANIAVHGQRIFNYFVQLGVDPADLEKPVVDSNNISHPPLRARVAKPGLPQLDMGFYFGDTPQQHWITFQRDESQDDAGLPALAGKSVHRPSYDPEVIYHELTHALMWLMNRTAFDGCNGNVPFGRALLEGYANYFGRSLATLYEVAAQNNNVPLDQPWARAAYRTEPTNAAWGDAWALARTKQVDGQDRLPVPNLYPNLAITGLPVYDVGMILARGLWDLRAYLPASLLDRFALGAFDYLHGWIATFELVVEGLIDSAKHIAHFDTLAEKVFQQRGIVANQHIQAITSLETKVLVGADAGLMYSPDDGVNWQDWDQLNNALPLRNVVALTVDANSETFYAATEAGIWQRADSDMFWQQVGQWPPDQTPYTLGIFESNIYVGTGNGVWFSPIIAPIWQPLRKGDPTSDFVGASRDLTFATWNNGAAKWLIVATLGQARMCNITTPAMREWLSIPNKSGSPICSVAARENDLYLGTMNDGLWRFSLANLFGPPQREASSTAVNGAILTIMNRPTELVAGSSMGLFRKADFTAPNNWQPVVMPLCSPASAQNWPSTATISTMHKTDTTTWISTVTDGFWQLRNNTLCRVDRVARLTQ